MENQQSNENYNDVRESDSINHTMCVTDIVATWSGENMEEIHTMIMVEEKKGLLLTVLQNDFAHKKMNLREILKLFLS